MKLDSEPLIRALRPVARPYLANLSDHSDLMVWHIDVAFDAFEIPDELIVRWSDKETFVSETWQKSPLVVGMDSKLRYSCGEVELVARLRGAGYEAYWISEWSGFPHVAVWKEFCIKRSEFKERAPSLWEYDRDLRDRSDSKLGSSGGHPDIACVTPAGPVYFEYKGPGDSIKPKQNMWATAITQRRPGELAYMVVRGSVAGRSQSIVHGKSSAHSATGLQTKTFSKAATAPSTSGKLHRRTISDTLKRTHGWEVTSKVDGSIDFTPPRGVGVEAFVDLVRLAVRELGYEPTVRIGRGARGHSVVRVHTPETLEQAPRGEHGYKAR